MIQRIIQDLQHKFKNDPKRLTHIMGVYETATKLALHYKIDPFKVQIASLYHDYTKNDRIESQTALLTSDEVALYKDYPVMYHALSAEHLLQKNHHILDEEIIQAIRHHIWGRPQMSPVEMIVFIADYAEPNRTTIDANALFELACASLEKATLRCMEITLDYLKKQGVHPHPEQLEAYHYYKEVTRGET